MIKVIGRITLSETTFAGSNTRSGDAGWGMDSVKGAQHCMIQLDNGTNQGDPTRIRRNRLKCSITDLDWTVILATGRFDDHPVAPGG